MPTNSGGAGNWNIVEELSYQFAVSQCGTPQFFDEALAPIIYALHRNPRGFRIVPGFETIRIARTKLRIKGSEIIPSYRLWFRADDPPRTVHMLWVEVAPPEDMGFGKTFWDDDDDIPF